MAIVKYSALVSDIRGKQGGNVFSRNRGGGYVRTYVKPTNPSTPQQMFVRSQFQALVQTWKGLTDAVRAAWNAATVNFPYQDSLGNTKYYSGQQLFIKLNLNLLASGTGQNNDAPVAETVAAPGLTGVTTLTSASIELAFTEATVPAGAKYLILATNGLSAGVSNPPRSKYRQIAVFNAAADPEGDLIADYSGVFGAPLPGQRVFFIVRNIDQSHGQASSDVLANKVVS